MEKLTPMMAQYREIKSKYEDCTLMFRLGDFYEMFFEDAVEASKILQIALTSRSKNEDRKIPMCGVPYHALNQYLSKLTRAGKKVAVCDQMTAPDGKGPVEREVVRVVTPGTTFDDGILDSKTNNYVACVTENNGHYGFAYADVTTGDFRATEFENFKELESEISRINPAEYICEEGLLKKIKYGYGFPFDYSKDAEKSIEDHFEIKSLSVFGLEGKINAAQAAGMLLEYLKETQKTDLKHIQKISYYDVSDFMPLDESCIRNLELFYTNKGKKESSLIWAMDNTITPMGGRKIRNWTFHPLLKKTDIEERLNKVEVIKKDSGMIRNVREILGKIYDIERILSRLSLGAGNARDLNTLKDSLKAVPELKNIISELRALDGINSDLYPLENLVDEISTAIIDEPPISVREGGMIAAGYNQELDDLRSVSTEGKTFLKDVQEREIKRTGISSLKVRFNKVFGYYIEISKSNLAAVPDDYIRKQTLVNAERFIIPELKDYEEKILNAEDRIRELEYQLFYGVRMKVIEEIVKLKKTAAAIASMDVLSTFAFNAEKNNYCKPIISENGELEVRKGRHPVIEKMNFAGDFVPNDCTMNENKKFLLITGPNMGGKSTYLRQIALIVLMAQIGSYVPAESAKIGVVDRIFTRVGASDNLAKGESTFMVEMQEAAYILNNASEKSLIILDELGRGTSTYDGVGIAWAICEFIHDNIKAKTLFATHYHELIELADRMDKAANLSVSVVENEKDGVVFLYKVVDGGVDKSYGIEVAKLAGVPVDVISRARGVLNELETKHIQKKTLDPDQMGLFGSNDPRGHGGLSDSQTAIMKDLKFMNIDNLTPIEALHKLAEMKKKTNE
ncbi:MAG: DNA mismatch repair protein MutS [Candidatus Peregrinibacteria bacterium]